MNIALILLGGIGSRMGADLPKQFLEKDNKPIYIYTIEKYSINVIDGILLVVNPKYIERVKNDISNFKITNVIDVIPGGKNRFDSSYIGISYLKEKYEDSSNVLIADAVRPNTDEIIIMANIFALNESNAVLTAIPGEKQKERVDTAHIIGNNCYLAQTPQSFKLGYIYSLYKNYYKKADFNPTDDINLVEMFGDKYTIVEGNSNNYKITTPEDFETFLKN